MAFFELDTSQKPEYQADTREGLGSDLLVNNARWFIGIRWFVLSVFIVAGVALWFTQDRFAAHDVASLALALFVLAGVLLIANIIFIIVSAGFSVSTPSRPVRTVIWAQIICDLAVVTTLVHLVGSTSTFVPFTYLFHVALACIFFPKRESLLVTVTAVGLYVGVVVLKLVSAIPDLVIFPNGAPPLLQAGSAIFVWLVVWYLVSTLSEGVRLRDGQLQRMNSQLIEADAEKNQQMLVITHDLKAPFSGIESNIEVLKVKFWEDLDPDAQQIIDRINNRSRVLRQRINAILMLGQLRSPDTDYRADLEEFDMHDLVEFVCEDLAERAAERTVKVNRSVDRVTVRSNRKKLIVLFENLISNAINYSFEGGVVDLDGHAANGSVRITVTDHGIGIRSDALPHIFDEYFRSREAARFNRSSTGLGLAIVREIAAHLDIAVSVQSEEGKGTSFAVRIPSLIDQSANNRRTEDADDHDH